VRRGILLLGIAAVLGLAAVLSFGSVATAVSCGDFEHPAAHSVANHDSFQQFALASIQRQDTPNDTDYDRSETDHYDHSTCAVGATDTNFFDERSDLFGFPSTLTPNATYKDGSFYPDVTNTNGQPKFGKPMVSGFNAAGAWKLERGRRDVVVAILDTGIKWDHEGLRTQIHLNTGELPYPEVSGPALDPSVDCTTYDTSGATYDPDHDGGANVLDYACDPRVSVTWSGRAGPANKITAQDLIHRFGKCKITNHQLDVSAGSGGCPAGGSFDNDGNGYKNDIAGWNFFDNNNDPTDLSSYFAAGNHGSGRADDAVERGNDGDGSIGVCPHCEVMPIRVWDTFVSDGNTFGLGMTYATDNGAKVIEGADGSLDHTAFAEAASQYAFDHGVVQTYSGDDLNTANHNYPANYSHAMLIQGNVADTEGLGSDAGSQAAAFRQGLCGPTGTPTSCPLATNLPVGTFFRGANTTQFGAKSSISMTGTTGSANTGKASGAAGLVVSAGLNQNPSITLSPDEVRELLEQTAERVTTGNTSRRAVDVAFRVGPRGCGPRRGRGV